MKKRIYNKEKGEEKGIYEISNDGGKNKLYGRLQTVQKGKRSDIVILFFGMWGGKGDITTTKRVPMGDRYDTFNVWYRGQYPSQLEGRPSKHTICEDALAAYEYVEKLGYKKIVVMADSFGTGIAIYVASQKPKTHALITDGAYTTILGVLPWYLSMLLPACRYNFNSLSYIKKVTCPTLITHGKRDMLIPYSHGRKLYHAIPKEVRDQGKIKFLGYNGSHNDFVTNGKYLAYEKIQAFINNPKDFPDDTSPNKHKNYEVTISSGVLVFLMSYKDDFLL